MVLGFLQADRTQMTPLTQALTLMIGVGLPALGAAALLRGRRRRPSGWTARQAELARATLEAEVLKLATNRGGKLTAAEVVIAHAVDEATAEVVLGSMAEEGRAEIELTDDGVIVYAFRGLADGSQKASAKGVLDA